jgi:hypothetical protein
MGKGFTNDVGKDRADAVLRGHPPIVLSLEGQLRLASLLLAKPAPTGAMAALRRMPRLKVRDR